MHEIQVSEKKTLKLTNAVARKVKPEEMRNLPLILTQLQNYIKSNNAQPIGPLVQHMEVDPSAPQQANIYFIQQATQMITRLDPDYHVDPVLRVKGCLYAHYVGPMARNDLATQKLNIYAFENDIETAPSIYTIFVSQGDEDAVVDVFMETK